MDDIGACREQTMEMLLHLHLSAVTRLDWAAPALASYLVDRILSTSRHPFQWDADLYAEQLGDAFRVAVFDEIDSRLAGLANLPAVSTAGPKDARRLLTQLRTLLE